ncbi:hypothetical protein GCM10010440_70790 [Kitasatospora cinereorecta]
MSPAAWSRPRLGPRCAVSPSRTTPGGGDSSCTSAHPAPPGPALSGIRPARGYPALADEESADRRVHWWRPAYAGHIRAGYPPVALVVTGAG